MDKSIKSISSNAKSAATLILKQITELGGLSIIVVIMIYAYFFNKTLAIQLLIGMIAVTIIASAIKLIFFRERPKKQSYTNIIERIDASSFPSVHSARITIVSFWLIFYSTNLILQIFLAVIGIIVIYSRVYLKKHYYKDVLGGIILGAIINVMIYYLYMRVLY